MKIQVVGSGCPTCKKLYEITQKAVKEMSIECEVEYVSGDKGTIRIIELGAISSPLLVVNNEIVMTGYTSNREKIKAKINGHI
jgi:small redox-active disulfide protein 2